VIKVLVRKQGEAEAAAASVEAGPAEEPAPIEAQEAAVEVGEQSEATPE